MVESKNLAAGKEAASSARPVVLTAAGMPPGGETGRGQAMGRRIG